MTRKYFSQTNLDFRILDIQNSVFQTGRRPARRGLYSQKTLIQNTCKKITIHFGFVYYDWLRLINIWAGAPPLWAGPKWPDPMRRRAGSV